MAADVINFPAPIKSTNLGKLTWGTSFLYMGELFTLGHMDIHKSFNFLRCWCPAKHTFRDLSPDIMVNPVNIEINITYKN